MLTLPPIPTLLGIQGMGHKGGGLFEFQTCLKAEGRGKSGQASAQHWGFWLSCMPLSHMQCTHISVWWGWEDTMVKARRSPGWKNPLAILFSLSLPPCTWTFLGFQVLEAGDITITTASPFTLNTRVVRRGPPWCTSLQWPSASCLKLKHK